MVEIIAFASGPTCNWYWGSHGCDMAPGHEGIHQCGTREDPCSRHDGARVLYHYVGGDWATEWLDSTGFCIGDGIPRRHGEGNYPPCGDPDRCSGRDTEGHRGW